MVRRPLRNRRTIAGAAAIERTIMSASHDARWRWNVIATETHHGIDFSLVVLVDLYYVLPVSTMLEVVFKSQESGQGL